MKLKIQWPSFDKTGFVVTTDSIQVSMNSSSGKIIVGHGWNANHAYDIEMTVEEADDLIDQLHHAKKRLTESS